MGVDSYGNGLPFPYPKPIPAPTSTSTPSLSHTRHTGEKETLFPPLTFMQPTHRKYQTIEHVGVTMAVVEATVTLA